MITDTQKILAILNMLILCNNLEKRKHEKGVTSDEEYIEAILEAIYETFKKIWSENEKAE